MIRFYADEHIARAVVRGLRNRGVDALTVAEADLLGASDEEHLAFALGERRVIVTQDDDFLTLAAAGMEHAGIVFAPFGRSVGDIVRGLVLIHSVLDGNEMAGQIEFL